MLAVISAEADFRFTCRDKTTRCVYRRYDALFTALARKFSGEGIFLGEGSPAERATAGA